MPYTEQKLAGIGKSLALAARETLFACSWGIFGGAVLIPLTSYWYVGIPPFLLGAVYALSSTETVGRAGPLASLELRQYSSFGRRRTSFRATFTRIICTVLLLPPLAVGFIPMLFGKRSLPELFSRTRITVADRGLDPRPQQQIDKTKGSAKKRLRALTLAPLTASAAIFILSYTASEVISSQQTGTGFELPVYEQELLAQYLELTAMHPEELEYHVRLASLYYRNSMEQDLMGELEIIAGIDPEHAILLLADTTEFSFHLLEPSAEDTPMPDTTITLIAEPVVVQEDSAEADTLAGSLQEAAVQDTIPEASPDTLPPVPEDTSAVLPAAEPALEEEEPDTIETLPEEEAFEPDTIIQP